MFKVKLVEKLKIMFPSCWGAIFHNIYQVLNLLIQYLKRHLQELSRFLSLPKDSDINRSRKLGMLSPQLLRSCVISIFLGIYRSLRLLLWQNSSYCMRHEYYMKKKFNIKLNPDHINIYKIYPRVQGDLIIT